MPRWNIPIRSWEEHTLRIDTLSEYSQNRRPYCVFSGFGDCPNKIILPFPNPEEMQYLYVRGHPARGAGVHESIPCPLLTLMQQIAWRPAAPYLVAIGVRSTSALHECAPRVRWYPMERGGDLGEATEIAYY